MASASSFGQGPEGSVPQKLDAYFTALAGLGNFNGNVFIAEKGKVLLDKTYCLPTEIQGLQVTKDSRFVIASVSKVFIHFAILKLVEMQKLSLEDALKKFIPDFPNGEKITINHLLHHQSGLPRELTDYAQYDQLSLAQVVEMAKHETLEFEPGTQEMYSNVGFFLLHAIIGQTAPGGYESFMQSQILRPLGLRHTGELNRATETPHFAEGYDHEDGKIVASDKVNVNRFETGNIVSTIGDMARFGRLMLRGKVINPGLVMEMFAADSLLAQAGGRPGYRAYFYKNLKTDVLFIFLANYTDIPIQAMTADIVRIVNREAVAIPKRIDRQRIVVQATVLQRYEGSYVLESDAKQTFTLRAAEGALQLVDRDGEVSVLLPDTETSFFEDPASNDGLEFGYNTATGQFDLTMIFSGLRLKARRTN